MRGLKKGIHKEAHDLKVKFTRALEVHFAERLRARLKIHHTRPSSKVKVKAVTHAVG